MQYFFSNNIYVIIKIKKEKNIRENDYQQGYDIETKIFDKLRQKGYIVNPTTRYDYYDCKINQKYACEIKKRNIKKDTFDTTILPFSKIQQYKQEHKKFEDLIMIFSFQDGDYYTSYKKLCKIKERIKIDTFTRYSGFQHNKRKHIFIPTDILKPLNRIKLKCFG